MMKTEELGKARSFTGREVRSLAWVGVQVGVILLLARAFNLESPAFYSIVLPLAAGGFLVHHWLPRAWQPWFFAALSIAGVFLIFGVVGGGWLVGIGLGLIAMCHLPVAFRWRIVLISLTAVGLAAMRASWLPAPWPGVIWPVLGSIFMFRLAMYLYDLKHHGPAAPGLALSYFFLLPNSVFLLFPVIDFRTFRRTYYDQPAFEIYGEGVRWMVRGLTHLVIYRVIYQYVTLSPAEVTSTATLVQYLVANYGLYLRVSGQFHMIVGLLHLFGFRLPETHRFFYLASSFSDFWRRINIYWKDFMQKMVYLPVVLGLQPLGEKAALVGATACVVLSTWLLQSYQWFWLLGQWLLSATDMAFRGAVGLLMIGNALREHRRGRVRQLSAAAPAPAQAWRIAVQTAGMFLLMSFLWGLWTSPTFDDFLVLLSAATWRMRDVAVVVITVAVVAAVAYLSRRLALGVPSAVTVRPRWQHPMLVGALPLALFWVAGAPLLEGRVPAGLQTVSQQARNFELNDFDAERLQRGYYEKIVGVNRFNGQLWEVYARAEKGPEADEVLVEEVPEGESRNTGIWIGVGGELRTALKPSLRTNFRGARFTTNRWGMRDKEYPKARPPNTVRIALLGQSYVMGSGVSDDETFEALIEERLNREWYGTTGFKYELLNFAVSNYTLDKNATILRNGRVEAFEPQAVIVVGSPGDDLGILRNLLRQLRSGDTPPDPVSTWFKETGIVRETSEPEALKRLAPYRQRALQWAFDEIVNESHRIGAQPVYALIPVPRPNAPTVPPAALGHAARAGFLVIDLRDVYAGHDQSLLTVSASDYHPNTEGHQIIADRLYESLIRLPPGFLTPADSVTDLDRMRLQTEWNRTQVPGARR